MTPEELEALYAKYPELRPVAAPVKAAARPKARPPAVGAVPTERSPQQAPPSRSPAVAPLPPEALAAGTSLTPRQQTRAVEDFGTVQGEQLQRKSLAQLKADLAEAPDFDTYMTLSREIEAAERTTVPEELPRYAGAPTASSARMGPLGFPFLSPAPSAPMNVPRTDKLGFIEGLAEAARPRSMVGPVGEQRASSPEAKARQAADLPMLLLPDTKLAKDLEGKTGADRAAVLSEYGAHRAMIRTIAEKNPELSAEEVAARFIEEIEDLPKALQGQGRLGTTKLEPGKAPNMAQIYAPLTTPGFVPNISDAQSAFLTEYYTSTRATRGAEVEKALREKLQTEDIVEPAADITEAEVAAGGTPRMATRKRRPEEVEAAVRAQLPGELAGLSQPWFTTGQRSEIIANPEKFATKEFGKTVYPGGATKESFGANMLRVALAPANIITTGLSSGAARLGEAAAAGAAPWNVPQELSAPGRARAKRAEALPGLAAFEDGFLGDLVEAAYLGRGAAGNVEDIYKELGLNPTVGFGAGLLLDIITPPMGGIASGTAKGVQAARAVKAAQATGLLTKVTPAGAAASAFGNSLREAWLWSKAGRNAVDELLPGSMRLAAAEETAKVLGFRDSLREAAEVAGRPLTSTEAKAIYDNHLTAVGPGRWNDDFKATWARGDAMNHISALTDDVSAIPAKGHYLSGMKKLLGEADDVMAATRTPRATSGGLVPIFDSAAAAKLPEPLIRTILNNAAGRSQKVADMLAKNPNLNAVEQLGNAVAADAAAVRAAAPAVAAADALMRATTGFKDLTDLVAISRRFIGTPKAAMAVLDEAAKSTIGKNLAGLTKTIEDGSRPIEYARIKLPVGGGPVTTPGGAGGVPRNLIGARLDKPYAVVEVDPVQAKRLIADMNTLRAGGFMSDADHSLAMMFLDRTVAPKVPVESLRALAEANLDSVASTLGKGVDVERVRFRPETLPDTRAGRLETAEEARARSRIMTPKEMRSVFDGFGAYALAVVSKGEQVRALLDMPPTMEKAVADFYAKSKDADKAVKALIADLMKPGNPKRAIYNLPPDGPLEPREVLTAVSRGLSMQETGEFMQQVSALMTVGSEATALRMTAGTFFETSYYTMNAERYFTTPEAYQTYTKMVRQAAVDMAAPGGDVLYTVRKLRDDIDAFMANNANSSSIWRAERGTVVDAEMLPDIIGGALYGREVSALQRQVVEKALTEDAVRETFRQARNLARVGDAFDAQMSGLLGAMTGDPRLAALSPEDSMRALINASMKARDKGNRATRDVLYEFMDAKYKGGLADYGVVDAVLAGNPTLARTLDNIMPLVNAAADSAKVRGGLNLQSVEDTIDLTQRLVAAQPAKYAGIAGTRQLVRGTAVQDSIDAFVRDGVQQKVFAAAAANLPSKNPAYQSFLGGLMTLAKNVGNVRYNLFLYARLAYQAVNIMTAPAIMHATLGGANFPGVTAMSKAVRAMEGSRTGVEVLTPGLRASVGVVTGATGLGTLTQSGVGGLMGAGLGAAAGVGKPLGRLAGAADEAVAFRDAAGRIWTYDDLREVGLRSGILKTEQQVLFGADAMESLADEVLRIERTSGRVVPGQVKEALKDIARAPADWANSTDNFWRMSSMIEALSQGKPIGVAQEIARKSLFDYGSLTEAERAFASRFLIFYTFARVNTEQMVKMFGSTAAMTRFVRQAALGRDVGELMYEASGGEEYDVRRFYMSDRALSQVVLGQEQEKFGQTLTLFPSIPSQEAFMTMTGLLYQSNPLGVVTGTETGLARYLDPALKVVLDSTREMAGAPAFEKRADRLRLMDPRHVALLYDVEAMAESDMLFGPLTPLPPGKETSMTFIDQEWQMTPGGYKLYKGMQLLAQTMGLESTANYYVPLTQPETVLQRPGKDELKFLAGAGISTLPTLTAEQAEASALSTQAKRARDAARLREQTTEAISAQQTRGAAEEGQ